MVKCTVSLSFSHSVLFQNKHVIIVFPSLQHLRWSRIEKCNWRIESAATWIKHIRHIWVVL